MVDTKTLKEDLRPLLGSLFFFHESNSFSLNAMPIHEKGQEYGNKKRVRLCVRHGGRKEYWLTQRIDYGFLFQ